MPEYKSWCGEWRMPGCCNICRSAVAGCLELVNYENTHIDAFEIEVISDDNNDEVDSDSTEHDDKGDAYFPLQPDDVFSGLCSPSTVCSPVAATPTESLASEQSKTPRRPRRRRSSPPPPRLKPPAPRAAPRKCAAPPRWRACSGNPVAGDMEVALPSAYCFTPTAVARVELPDYRFLLDKYAARPPAPVAAPACVQPLR